MFIYWERHLDENVKKKINLQQIKYIAKDNQRSTDGAYILLMINAFMVTSELIVDSLLALHSF